MPRLFIQGGGAISLTKADFLAAGGEGEVYVQGKRAFKVYHNPAKMIPTGKITDLAALTAPCFVKPEHVLCDAQGHPVGYDMQYVKDAWALCQTFPKVFRDREGMGHDKSLALVRKLQEGVDTAHKAHILIVDLNEMNFLVGKDFKDIYFIDADSYQTAHYAATAIMESVRDPKHDYSHGKGSESADWFSFAVVSFQMFTGIHPFKGKHPSIKGLSDRMAAGISVFDPSVSMPPVVYPLTVIPANYRDWYEALFVKGLRVAPPTGFTTAVVLSPQLVRAIASSAGVDISDLFTLSASVRGVWDAWGRSVVLTEDGLYLDQRRVCAAPMGAKVAFTPASSRTILAVQDVDALQLLDVENSKLLPFTLKTEQVMCTQGRLYIKSGGQIYQVKFVEAGQKILASAEPAANCMEHATRLYEGVAVQSMLGMPYITLFPKLGESYTLKVEELKGYKVVDAKAEGNVLMVVAGKSGKYDRLVFRFGESFQEYDLRKQEDISPSGLNFVVLDNGVVACLTEDDKLELFSARKGSATTKIVEDKALGGDMRLCKVGGKVAFWRDNKVCRLSTK